MILAGVEEWRPEPGRVLVWGPTPASTAAAAAAPVSPGPPSYLQVDHLAAYAGLAARGGQHRAWTGVATVLDGALDRDALGRALERFVARHEGLRTWFDLSGTEPVRHLLEPGDVELDVEVAERTGRAPAGEDWHAALHTMLTDLFTERCRPDAWPGWSLVTVEGPGSFGLAWGCDHAFTDGVSQVLLAGELGRLYDEERGAVDRADPTPGERPAGFVEHVRAERAAAKGLDSRSPEVVEWVESVARHGGRLPEFPLDLGLEPGETAPVRIRSTDLLDAEEVAALDRVCREAGARMTGAVFAALAETGRLLTGREDHLAVTVLSTRRGPWTSSQGWFCTFAPVEVSTGAHPGFAALAATAQAAFERAKRLGAVPVPLVLETLVRSGTLAPDQLGSPQLVSYIDLRWFPDAGTPAHDNGVHFTGLGRTANASMWVNRDHERLYVVAQTPDTPRAQAAVTTYHGLLRAVLRAAARGERVGHPVLEEAHAGHDR
ncbi:hypothetical protein GHK92_04460 [Nocardioides sp. dk4132]|uniref:condensation domain-containing protein n=1 Tax=unclassified Nocardioides TaxID=2615069 RepID=UPI001296D769|nr:MULTISPECIES: condensation domain-containing protein [unclassified Nocardioides]MQW75117.1 hypothetical protein [Nocardioides sp. dk4132]QGA07716.1 hypothetical protein GFH29_10145 [Nocardioides sp. dk884]